MSKQHPTPWGISESTGLLIDAKGNSVIGSPDIQRRITACVNGCDGIPTKWLIKNGIGCIDDMHTNVMTEKRTTEQQRSEAEEKLAQLESECFEGYPTGTRGVFDEVKELSRQLSKAQLEIESVHHSNSMLEQQRDELLSALQEVVRISDRKHDAWDKAHTAIAKAVAA